MTRLWWLVALALAKPPSVEVTEEAVPPPPPPTPIGVDAAPILTPEQAGPSVIEDLGDGVTIDWTRLVLRAEDGTRGYGVAANRRAVEQDVRRLIGPKMLGGARSVRVTADQRFADLEAQPEIADALRSRVERWSVAEARYFASGKVELTGDLSLQELLKPWALSVARPLPAEPPGPDQPTGLLIDARGSGVSPSYAPRVLSPTGDVLFDAVLWEDYAIAQPVAVWVPTADHPATQRVGDRPIHLRAARARGADLILAEADVPTLGAQLSAVDALRRGTIVVLVDP